MSTVGYALWRGKRKGGAASQLKILGSGSITIQAKDVKDGGYVEREVPLKLVRRNSSQDSGMEGTSAHSLGGGAGVGAGGERGGEMTGSITVGMSMEEWVTPQDYTDRIRSAACALCSSNLALCQILRAALEDALCCYVRHCLLALCLAIRFHASVSAPVMLTQGAIVLLLWCDTVRCRQVHSVATAC